MFGLDRSQKSGDVALGYLSLWTPVTPGALVKSLDLLELSPPLQNEGVRDEFIPGRCDSICGKGKESSNLLFLSLIKLCEPQVLPNKAVGGNPR